MPEAEVDARVDAGAAIARWQAALGDAHVWTDARLDAAGATTFPTHQRPIAWLQPADTAEVQACVRIAHELGVPLQPASGGKNWGYGSRVPARDGAAILDLARLARIVDFDERLAYVTVEPGVTFRQLARFLRSCRARVFASVTGGPADGSVVANALERGDGAGPLGDRFGHVCGLEVVLPTGALVHTGFARFGGPVAPLARWGVGPALDGLFSQSGLGIVTRMTVWLAPYPRAFALAAWTLDDDARLPAVVDALRGLRLAGVTPATVPIWNDYKALALAGTYPWDAAAGVTPLPAAVRAAACARAGLGRWNGTVSLYGASQAHAAALRALVDDALGPHAALRFHDGPDDPLDADEERCGPALGVPHDRSAAACYWRKHALPARLDPDADRCGFVWVSHALPFTGEHAREVAEVVEAELLGAGFEPQLALLGVADRALSAVASISYDRDVPGEDARALAAHDRLTTRLAAQGYPPFRRGLQSPPAAGEPAYDALVASIADALDPRGILRRDGT